MKAPSVRHFFLRTAEAFGFNARDVLLRYGDTAEDARQAFILIAGRQNSAKVQPIATALGLCTRIIQPLYDAAHERARTDVQFQQKVDEIELECTVEIGVAARKAYRLPPDNDPFDIAWALVSSDSATMGVSLDDLNRLGASYVSLVSEVADLRAQLESARSEIAPDGLTSAVKVFLAAGDLYENALSSPAEKAACLARKSALKTLKNCFTEKDKHDVA